MAQEASAATSAGESAASGARQERRFLAARGRLQRDCSTANEAAGRNARSGAAAPPAEGDDAVQLAAFAFAAFGEEMAPCDEKADSHLPQPASRQLTPARESCTVRNSTDSATARWDCEMRCA